MQKVELFDKNSIDHIKWPKSEESSQAQQLPLQLLKNGVEKYITNIQTKFYFLKIDDFIIPITVNEAEYNNSYLTSNYYAVKQMRLKMHKLYYPLAACVGYILKKAKVNRVVIVNNWLLSNSLYPKLSNKQLTLMKEFLLKQFPDHMIMMRGLNEAHDLDLLEQLKKEKYYTFYSRKIFHDGPKVKKGKRSNYHRRRDERLMQSEKYEVGTSEDFQKLIWLYDRVYKDKHTIYSPRYTADYLKHAVETGFLNLVVIKKEGVEVGVFGYSIRNGIMIVPFFGYDISCKKRTEVYRILTTLILKKAAELNVALNDGSGGDQAKKFRGMKAANEYAAIYTHHLPLFRKMFWKIARCFSKSF